MAFDGPIDLTFNRGPIADPAAFAQQASAASWLYLCGEEFAAMEGGMSYDSVQAAVPESVNIVSDPPRVMTWSWHDSTSRRSTRCRGRPS